MIPLVIGAFPFLGFIGADPAPSFFRTKENARSLECERVGALVGRARKPNEVRPERPRGNYVERDVLLCRQRLLREGLRAPLDEAILKNLEPHVSEVAAQVASVRGDLVGRTWLVETFTPNPVVATKVSFALKSALMRQSLRVSDRLPLLSATDVDILLHLPPAVAYPAACARWQETDQLRSADVLVAQVTRDLRETYLHTGLCVDGQWTWVQ